jgi:ubiquinone/menaquinone biosynthesis C-methylase UbiE
MLDLGCGPGHIALLAVERIPGARVVGVDLAETMLTIARRRAAASRHGDRVEFLKGDAKGLAHGDGEFDAVFSNTILHHLADPAPFLCEAWRVLRPGGAFLVRDLFRPENEAQLDRLVALHAGGEAPRAQGLLRDSLRAALTPDELRALASDLGLIGPGGVELVIDSDRHMSLQKRAQRG